MKMERFRFGQSVWRGLFSEQHGSIVYFREMSSITTEAGRMRESYRQIGCHPFYVVQNGQRQEVGADCRTFFCVGYAANTPVCRDRLGKPFGGDVEIDWRMDLLTQGGLDTLHAITYFHEFPEPRKTAAMKERIAEWERVRCAPFYVLEFGDVVSGEGYSCEEIGKHPFFSASRVCIRADDGAAFSVQGHDDGAGFLCDVAARPDEYDRRLEAVRLRPDDGGDFWNDLGSPESEHEDRTSQMSSSPSPHGETGTVTLRRIFSDVPIHHEAIQEINDLHEKGIVHGYDDGTFRPEVTVNRAELLKLLVAGLHPDQIRAEANCFPDVTEEWFSPYVCAARRMAWIAGYPDGTFRPGRTVNRAEAIKMIVSSLTEDLDATATLPRDVSDSAWYAPYVRKAVALGIVTEDTFAPSEPLTRADAAVWIHRGIATNE